MMKYALAGAVACLTMAVAPAANATTFNVGGPNFQILSGTPFTPSISAIFFNGYDTAGAFDDTFEFTIPQNGIGSGSISTSFSSATDLLTITDLIINGVPYTVTSDTDGQAATVGGIVIASGILNTIRVVGFTIGAGGSYSGTATFAATPVPEPAAWALMIVGFAAVGATFRRRRTVVSFS